METRVIRKPQHALREIVESRLKSVKNARIHIGSGPGAVETDTGISKLPPDKTICIMEAVSYIMGYEDINDHPACTSETIRYLMINLNDGIVGDRRRAKLKDLIPEIVNTAPTKWKQDYYNGWRVITDKSDLDYKAAERTRRQMVRDMFDERYRQKRLDDEGYVPTSDKIDPEDLANSILLYERSPMPVIYEIVRALVAVAKFEGETREPTGGI